MHATSVTNVIDRLEAAGLVRREPNPRDGRGTLAVITEDGSGASRTKATADLNEARFGLGALDVDDLDACSPSFDDCASTPTTFMVDRRRCGSRGSRSRRISTERRTFRVAAALNSETG